MAVFFRLSFQAEVPKQQFTRVLHIAQRLFNYPLDLHLANEAVKSTEVFFGCLHGRFSNEALQHVNVWIGFDTYFS